MKIVCKMTTVLACCQTNRTTGREGERKVKRGIGWQSTTTCATHAPPPGKAHIHALEFLRTFIIHSRGQVS